MTAVWSDVFLKHPTLQNQLAECEALTQFVPICLSRLFKLFKYESKIENAFD